MRRLTCQDHEVGYETFVCSHLLESPGGLRYLQSDWNSDEDARPDAWCDACEEIRQKDGGDWTDESVMNLTLACDQCYDEILGRHKPVFA